jgi:hypothetical protein
MRHTRLATELAVRVRTYTFVLSHHRRHLLDSGAVFANLKGMTLSGVPCASIVMPLQR